MDRQRGGGGGAGAGGGPRPTPVVSSSTSPSSSGATGTSSSATTGTTTTSGGGGGGGGCAAGGSSSQQQQQQRPSIRLNLSAAAVAAASAASASANNANNNNNSPPASSSSRSPPSGQNQQQPEQVGSGGPGGPGTIRIHSSNNPPSRSSTPNPSSSRPGGPPGRQQPPSGSSPSGGAGKVFGSVGGGRKRKVGPLYEPVNLPSHSAHANQLVALHQITSLRFVLDHRHHQPPQPPQQQPPRHRGGNALRRQRWHVRGRSTLYLLVDESGGGGSNPAAAGGGGGMGNNSATATATATTRQLALHLRSTCLVKEVGVGCLAVSASSGADASASASAVSAVRKLRTSHHHADPLRRVLVKPPASYEAPTADGDGVNDDGGGGSDKEKYRFDADAQSSRGAAGMTSALRVASIASNMGELRVSFEAPPPPPPPPGKAAAKAASGNDGAATGENDVAIKRAAEAWKRDLVEEQDAAADGGAARQLWEEFNERSAERRGKRLEAVAGRLARASGCSAGTGGATQQQAAFKVTVEYEIPLLGFSSDDEPSPIHHLAGLHVIDGVGSPSGGGSSLPPHVYTTVGVYGDHEGPRSWVPCLDSAAVGHRSTHQITIAVTAPMKMGLSVVGSGEDFGISRALLHYQHAAMERPPPAESTSIVPATNATASTTGDGDSTSCDLATLEKELGGRHVSLLQDVASRYQSAGDGLTSTHVIPPEGGASNSSLNNLDSIHATVIWCSASWTPVPARALGFAIGPFKVLEDPEYFGIGAVQGVVPDDDDDDEEMIPIEERHVAFVEAARKNGEGIRQAYFAPMFERKYIHAYADTRLLPGVTNIRLLPMSSRHKEMSEKLDECISCATVGVPHRALSLMRDVLALPTFRTAAFTQIWIPDAVHGGLTSGAFHCCPEVLVNPFLGGAIMDARLLPPVGSRLPFYQGGRSLQFLQARSAVRSWITAAIPLGGNDDVANGYILSLAESFIMSLYERGHGAQGEGGGKGGVFHSRRYARRSGLNSANLDFLPVRNIEEIDAVIGGLGPVPIEERHNEQLWRSATNGSESHTSAADEFNVRQLLCRDAVEAVERGTDKDKGVPTPSMGWLGSHLSLTFLSSNASSSSDLGCGAMELLHPVGGLVYRALKSEILRGVVEGRAGIANLTRLFRAAFIAAHLDDIGEKELHLPRRDKKGDSSSRGASDRPEQIFRPPFVNCVNEFLKKKGLTHTLFARALHRLAGPLKEAHLLGTLVDVERDAVDPRTRRPFVDPEGFPNSFVRGASLLYCRVGVQVEVARDAGTSQSAAVKGVQMQAYCEPCIPEGGIAYGGPITMRVVENEGQFREYVKDLNADGSRRDWGAAFLHAQPVTTAKAQTAASGTIESGSKDTIKGVGQLGTNTPSLDTSVATRAFTDTNFHSGGFQAIELIRMTNLTPLLWVRIDPMGLFSGRISVFQPDACLAECLFHDGDAGAQVEAIRALAERPLRIQGSSKVTAVYDVNISELPVRILGDCLRGSPALHSSLPHTPAVRAQAALAIAQWQNNKAPQSKDSVGFDHWVGANLLFQYFRERFYSNGLVMPVKFSRLALKNNEIQAAQGATEGASANPKHDGNYQYLDSLEEGEERAAALEAAERLEMEEDEEYRIRSASVTAIASLRAKDGQTPPFVIKFLETLLEAEDAEMVGNLVYPDEELMVEQAFRSMKAESAEEGESDDEDDDDQRTPSFSFVAGMLVADALLALCYINIAPSMILDPTTGKQIQASGKHPVSHLMELAVGWLEWELYREQIRDEIGAETSTGVSGNCHNIIAASAVLALSNLAILIQSTSDPEARKRDSTTENENKMNKKLKAVSTSKFYIDLFDCEPRRNDLTRAACAQAMTCICCAADRFEKDAATSVGLLTALEFLLDRILENSTSPSLRQTLAALMMDACTGKVCSSHRVGSIAGRNDLIAAVARFFNGPLGASHGGDNGSAILTSVSPGSFPTASAVNDGARRGLRLVSRAGHPRESVSEGTIVRVARFATRLWRTINGEPAVPPKSFQRGVPPTGVCTYDGALRCSLLALWQWIWPRGCVAVLQVQDWKSPKENIDEVMSITDEEKAAATAEENALTDINRLVNAEIDRQAWRGEMATKRYEMFRAAKGSTQIQDVAAAEQGIGQPLPPIQRDAAFKQGGWIASAAQQRRAKALDGGTAVTKFKLSVKKASDV